MRGGGWGPQRPVTLSKARSAASKGRLVVTKWGGPANEADEARSRCYGQGSIVVHTLIDRS